MIRWTDLCDSHNQHFQPISYGIPTSSAMNHVCFWYRRSHSAIIFHRFETDKCNRDKCITIIHCSMQMFDQTIHTCRYYHMSILCGTAACQFCYARAYNAQLLPIMLSISSANSIYYVWYQRWPIAVPTAQPNIGNVYVQKTILYCYWVIAPTQIRNIPYDALDWQ